ncbi:A/G-specific adenine glycosylase [Candidatus Kaiserbacteria bacterium]|nr:A/G-specific adenine glycosylase [Candidatus Kaiserbacteria bacterium]
MYDDRKMRQFRTAVWSYYRTHGRHDLPWRRTRNPYKILVSEVMLQQTQIPRVLVKYKEFLKEFPTVRSLAQAPLSDVLRVWSGMGYNRRAKYLRAAAIEIVEKYGGRVPRTAVALRSIAGIGPYTASAILVFAFNLPDTMIETNIRAAFLHHFVSEAKECAGLACTSMCKPGLHTLKPVHDRDILPLITEAAEGQDPREWHWALMDYGSHIKKLHGNPARKSAHYAKQSKFEGSLRQVRGAILRAKAQGTPTREVRLRYPEKYAQAFASLRRDGLIT